MCVARSVYFMELIFSLLSKTEVIYQTPKYTTLAIGILNVTRGVTWRVFRNRTCRTNLWLILFPKMVPHSETVPEVRNH